MNWNWIGGIVAVAIAATAIYKLIKKTVDPRDRFLLHHFKFKGLIAQLANDEFSIKDWTEQVVDTDDRVLVNWWKSLVNGKEDNAIKLSLLSCLRSWGVEVKVTKINPRLAKKAFIDNINNFAPILDSLNNETFSKQEWTERIISVNDENLTTLWREYAKEQNLQIKLKQLLASWQLRCDTCKSFTCTTADNIAAYALPNGDQISMGVKYKVVSPCWVLTLEDENGQCSKKVVNKGVVIPAQ